MNEMQAYDLFSRPLAASPWPVQVVVICGLAVLAVSIAWWLVIQQNKSTRMNFREDYWPEIEKGNLAVAFYRGIVIACIFGLVGFMFSRFA